MSGRGLLQEQMSSWQMHSSLQQALLHLRDTAGTGTARLIFIRPFSGNKEYGEAR